LQRKTIVVVCLVHAIGIPGFSFESQSR